MSNNYVSTRVTAHTLKKAKAQITHDMRLKDIRYLRGEPDITATISDQNEIRHITSDMLQHIDRETAKNAMHECLRQHDEEQRKKNPKNAKGGRPIENTFISGVLTFSPDGINDIPTAELDKAAQQTLAQICAELHVRPVYIVRHNDEKTPHYHYMLEGTDQDTGKAVASRINRDMCRRLQDIAAEHYAPLGLQRGRSKTITNANHLSILESHRAEAEKAQKTLDGLRQQLDSIKAELKRTRATAEERKRMDTEERKKLDEERRILRVQQKALREEIDRMTKEANETAERLKKIREDTEKAETKKIELMNEIKRMTPKLEEARRLDADRVRRRQAIATMLYRLRDAGVQLCNIAKRYTVERGNNGDWRPLPDLKLYDTRNVIGYAEDLLRDGGEAHIKLYGTPAVFALDDISPEELQRIKTDFGGTLATVETSPSNYQVWIAFASGTQPLKPDDWRAVNSYLCVRYKADKNADRAGHYFRLPGFRRVDNPDWTAKLTEDPAKICDRRILDKLIDIAMPRWTAKEALKKEIAQNADIAIERTAAPDWFVQKWLKAWNKFDKDDPDKQLTYSEIDWAVSCNLLRNAPEHQRARYAGYIADILSQAGEKREKSPQYGDITAAKAYNFIEAER